MDEDSDWISWDEYRKAFAAEPSSDSNYVAYYKILVNVYCKGFGHFPLVLLSGMFFCDCVDFGSEGVPSLARKLGRSVKRLHRRTPSVNSFVLFLVIFMLSVLGIVTFGNL